MSSWPRAPSTLAERKRTQSTTGLENHGGGVRLIGECIERP
jgi:hypothetical protein